MIKINKKKFILFILKEDIFLVCREIMIKKKKFFNLDIIGEKIIYKKKIEILDYSKLNPRGYFNLTYLAILYENYHLLPIRQRNRFIIRFQSIPKENKTKKKKS